MEAARHDQTHRRIDHWVFAWCSLTQRARRWQADLDAALRPQGLVSTEFLVLWRTEHAAPPGISQIELARELNVSAAQVCGVVESLQNRGWLKTARPPDDRRRLYCSLTALGRQALETLLTELLPVADRCLSEASAASAFIQEEAA